MIKLTGLQWQGSMEFHKKNAGQVLKETATKHGIEVSGLEQKTNTTPRIRRCKCKLSGGEISMPCLPTVSNIREQKQQLILTGELNIGEPCAPFHFYYNK